MVVVVVPASSSDAPVNVLDEQSKALDEQSKTSVGVIGGGEALSGPEPTTEYGIQPSGKSVAGELVAKGSEDNSRGSAPAGKGRRWIKHRDKRARTDAASGVGEHAGQQARWAPGERGLVHEVGRRIGARNRKLAELRGGRMTLV